MKMLCIQYFSKNIDYTMDVCVCHDMLFKCLNVEKDHVGSMEMGLSLHGKTLLRVEKKNDFI